MFPKPSQIKKLEKRPNGVTVCAFCSKDLFKSARCRDHYFQWLREKTEQRRLRRGPKKCQQCGAEFLPKRLERKYCSQKCGDSARLPLLRKTPPPDAKIKCRECGKDFLPSRNWGKFCSRECKIENRRARCHRERKATALISATCIHCEKHFEQPKRFYEKRSSKRVPKFCSLDCGYAYRRLIRGKPPIMGGRRWTVAADEARERDKNSCVICAVAVVASKTVKKIAVDHVIPRRLMERWELEVHHEKNLACLCGSCHSKKTAIEAKLFIGDLMGFVGGLASIGYPFSVVEGAFEVAEMSTSVVRTVYGV